MLNPRKLSMLRLKFKHEGIPGDWIDAIDGGAIYRPEYSRQYSRLSAGLLSNNARMTVSGLAEEDLGTKRAFAEAYSH